MTTKLTQKEFFFSRKIGDFYICLLCKNKYIYRRFVTFLSERIISWDDLGCGIYSNIIELIIR